MSTKTPVRTAEKPGFRLGQTEVVAIVLLVILLSQRWLLPLLDHDLFNTWGTIFVAIVVQSAPFLLGGVLLSAVISTFLSEKALSKIVPKSPALGVPVAGLAGIGLPGCECAAVPVTNSLIRRGVAPAVALTFLLAAPAVNPAVLVSTAVAFPGQPVMVLARFLASLITAVAVGWIMLARGKLLLERLTNLGRDEHAHGRSFLGNVSHDFLHASGFLVLGAMLAAAVNTFVPRSVVNTVAGQAVLGIATLALFAFIVALCSESDAFVAASFTAFSDTAKLVFLVVGPAMDIKLASMEAGQFGMGFALRFVPLVIITAVASAVGIGWWLL
ncbi:permease [Nocardioides sp. NBC_00850]|uniref:permease n=1 Tax=Nocardioides sp. NBC_00850 TaxID=2976001 RepID=UPI003870D958|nr:permease [Nocardioides sp. NBC_00850]